MKIARLSKVVEESQKLKRENLKLNFLTNIFGKSYNKNQKIKKLQPANFKDVKNNHKGKKGILNTFFTKIFQKQTQTFSPKRIGKMLSSKNMTNKKTKTIAIKPVENFKEKHFEINLKPDNQDNQLQSKNDNNSSRGSYNYIKIINPKLVQGKSINYNDSDSCFSIMKNNNLNGILIVSLFSICS